MTWIRAGLEVPGAPFSPFKEDVAKVMLFQISHFSELHF